MIGMLPSTKLRHLKQAIKDDLGIKDKVNIKLYLPITMRRKRKRKRSRKKERHNNRRSRGPNWCDKLTIKEAGILEQRDKLEVEVFIRVSIDVQGKARTTQRRSK